MMSPVEPVASEPRIFVGQVPTDKTEEDLFQLFLPFGRIRNLHLIREGPEGKSRGCAMVLFDRWSEAEAAIEAHDGKTVLDGRTLVVKVASPRRQPSETGIAPKKLFIGQVLCSVSCFVIAHLYSAILCGLLQLAGLHATCSTLHALIKTRYSHTEAAFCEPVLFTLLQQSPFLSFLSVLPRYHHGPYLRACGF